MDYISKLIIRLKNCQDDNQILELLKEIYVCIQLDSNVRKSFEEIL